MASLGSFLRGLFGRKKPAPPSASDFLAGKVPPEKSLDRIFEERRQQQERELAQTRADILHGLRQDITKELGEELRKPAYAPPELLRDAIVAELGPNHTALPYLLSGDWLQMTSTNVDQSRYFYHDRTLDVRFLSGGGGTYFDVPWEVAAAFFMTASPGRFVWNFLRDVYTYRRVKRSDGFTKRSPKGRYPRGTSLRILNKEDIESGRKTLAQVKEENRTGARAHLGLRS